MVPSASTSPDEKGRYVRLTGTTLQYDFARSTSPLSPFALAAIELLDRESETYATSTCCR